MNGHQLHLTLQETRTAAEIGSWASFPSYPAVTTTCLRVFHGLWTIMFQLFRHFQVDPV